MVDSYGRRWMFIFRKSEPTHKEYFMYWSLDRSKVAFDNYLSAQRRYKKSRRVISTSGISIFEADPLKMDAVYVREKDARNHQFLKHTLFMLIAALICDLATLLDFLYGKIGRATFFALFIFFFLIVVYFFVSTVLLHMERRKTSKHL